MTSAVGAEFTVSDDWLQATLTAALGPVTNSFGGVFNDLVPQNSVYPYVVFRAMPGSDVGGMGPHSRMMSNVNYLVYASSEGTYDSLVPVVNAMDTAIEGNAGTANGGHVLGCTRMMPYRMTENFEGRLVRNLGGQYRIYVQGT